MVAGSLALALLMLAGLTACGEEDVREAIEEVDTRARESAEGIGEEARTIRTEAGEQFGKALSAVDPDHTVAVTNFICPFQVEGVQPAAGNVVAMVEIEIRNTDEREIRIGPGDFKLETDDGKEHDALVGVTLEEALEDDISLRPGESARKQAFFEVPQGRKAPFLVDKAGAVPVKVQIPGQT